MSTGVERVHEPCYEFLACATLPENKGGSVTEAGDFDNVPQDGAPDRTFTHTELVTRGVSSNWSTVSQRSKRARTC